MRGLDALTVLNLRDGATVSEVAQEIHLPRTTVYRILETLCNAGFVFRDAADDRYRLTILVRALSDGFDDEAWVTQIAKPFINDLCHEIVWPVSIATWANPTRCPLASATMMAVPGWAIRAEIVWGENACSASAAIESRMPSVA